MKPEIKDQFTARWNKYFNGAELPITFFYTEEEIGEYVPGTDGHRCLMADLGRVRGGRDLRFGCESIGCAGGRRYTGFASEVSPYFEHFLSCGIPGKLEGERYKKSPELVREIVGHAPAMEAPARFIVFKRWDRLTETDEPEAVIFFAPPDVLSGLFTLANFDEPEPNGVITPFAAGCGSIIAYPFVEKSSPRPRAVLGTFDVSARPFVHKSTLTFAVPINKFLRMVENMDESFLITASWNKVRQRISATS